MLHKLQHCFLVQFWPNADNEEVDVDGMKALNIWKIVENINKAQCQNNIHVSPMYYTTGRERDGVKGMERWRKRQIERWNVWEGDLDRDRKRGVMEKERKVRQWKSKIELVIRRDMACIITHNLGYKQLNKNHTINCTFMSIRFPIHNSKEKHCHHFC